GGKLVEDAVPPPIRDRLYRLMVEDGLVPASPGNVRAGWMFAGAATAIAGLMLPSYGPSWLGFYDTWLRIGGVLSGLVFVGWSWVVPRKTRLGGGQAGYVRGFQGFLERAGRGPLGRMPAGPFE